jgi:AcrR family transcriptional regulator
MNSESAQVPLRERNRQRIYKRIVSAATDLFSTTGFERTTMDAIAEKAEVSRGTLFNYFPTKEALLIPFVQELYEQSVQRDILSYLGTQPRTLQVLQLLFMSIHEHILILPHIDRALHLEFFQPATPRPLEKKDCRGEIGFLGTLTAILRYGQQRGEVRVDIPLEQLARYVGVLYIALLYGMLEQGTSTQYAAEVDTLLTFLSPALEPV